MIRKGERATHVLHDGIAATVVDAPVLVLEVDECCGIALVRYAHDDGTGEVDEQFCGERIVELEQLKPCLYLLPNPVVNVNGRGRRRPPGYVAPRQDPARRAAAQRRLTEGADKLIECPACEELVEDLEDHVCNGETSAEAARSGSSTFAVAQENREGHRCLRFRGR